MLVAAGVMRELLDELVFAQEVMPDHRKYEPPVMPDIFLLLERIKQMSHNVALAQLVDWIRRCFALHNLVWNARSMPRDGQ